MRSVIASSLMRPYDRVGAVDQRAFDLFILAEDVPRLVDDLGDLLPAADVGRVESEEGADGRGDVGDRVVDMVFFHERADFVAADLIHFLMFFPVLGWCCF